MKKDCLQKTERNGDKKIMDKTTDEMTEDKVTMTREQFNKLNRLLEKISESSASAIYMTDIAFRMMPAHKKAGRATVCKVADDITKIKDSLWKISDLMKNVKDNYIKEISETTEKGEEINEQHE
jgi:hypothetical protein